MSGARWIPGFCVIGIWVSMASGISMPQTRIPTCSDNCTSTHQHDFSQELLKETSLDLEAFDLANLITFFQSLYSGSDSGLLDRICRSNQQLNTCLQYCSDSPTKEIQLKKSSIFFLMCDREYRTYAGCLMNSSFRSSSYMDKIEMKCEEIVSRRHYRSTWERLCQMTRCRILCLKTSTIERCGAGAFETAKRAALAAIDEYEANYLSQSMMASGRGESASSFGNDFDAHCDRKSLFVEIGDQPVCA